MSIRPLSRSTTLLVAGALLLLPGARPGRAADDPTPQAAAPAAEEPVLAPAQIPDVVATVDGAAILKADLLARATEAQGALAAQGVPPARPTRDFYRAVLDDLIGNRLLMRDLESQGKGATAQEVDEQLSAIRGQFKSEQEFTDMLAQRGFDRDRLRNDIRESLAVNRWVQETLIPTISVTTDEKKKFFADNEEQMLRPEGVRVRHVLVVVGPQDSAESKAAKRNQAEALRAKVTGGADFAAVAKESSQDPGTAPNGGEVGWVVRGQTVPQFEQVAFSLAPGKLSEVFATRFGFHFLEVEEKQPEKKLTFDEVQDRIENLIKQHKLEEAVRARVNELGAKAAIDIKL